MSVSTDPTLRSGLRIAIVGATGAVGQVALQILADRKWPADRLVLMASARSAGKEIAYLGRKLKIVEGRADAFAGIDVAFISATTAVSRELAPVLARQGVLVIDDSGAFRMQADVPLVVPEVNGKDVLGHRGIISIPNCTTTPLVMVLAALRSLAPLRRVTVATYQAVSGTGAAAVRELDEQNAAIVEGRDTARSVYPHRIAYNLLPQVDRFLDDGYTAEEHKMTNETRKILHEPALPLSSTCVRVPVRISHSEAVHVELARPVDPAEARRVLASFPGIRVVDDPANSDYPMPDQAAGKDPVLVGRIRRDSSHPDGLVLWLSCDNLRKGAALNAMQILDEAVRLGALKPRAAVN
ncbi:MAG: aspartate-semialdehyde dehydrogenase [SAR202 cluster bacterium]|nr:aspartate-semialdehyde dehydrogenase [SAR202 cluster bacterium]